MNKLTNTHWSVEVLDDFHKSKVFNNYDEARQYATWIDCNEWKYKLRRHETYLIESKLKY